MAREDLIFEPRVTVHKKNGIIMPEMHYHATYEIHIAESERTFLVTEQLIHLRERDVLLIKPNVVHCAVSESHTYTLIELPEIYLDKFFTSYGTELITACFEKNVIRVKESDFLPLLSYTENLCENTNDIFSLVQIFSILKNNMSRQASSMITESSLASNIVDYITENYKIIDDLDIITSTFYISKGYLCNLFKEHTGTSVIKYINMLKIQSSLEYISRPDLSIKDVAAKSGFGSIANFSETFKKIMGTSPLKYRKENIKK